jgi:Amt family ammonium transporter
MKRMTLYAAALLLLCASPVLAQEAAATPPAKLDSGDTAWLLVSSLLVLMMTVPGLAMFYGGMVRKKNVLSILMQCVSAVGLVTLLWVGIGYSLAFTEGNPFLGGFSRVFLSGMGVADLSGTIPESVFVMFQGTFAIITPALIVGAYADRMKFSAFLWFTALWLMAVYVPVAHMVWGPKGFLFDKGIMDFAGGTVVHINAGVAGLVAAYVIGKRKGYGSENMAPHNLTFTMIGAALLWVGWFGFNAGSALTASGLAGYAMLNTHFAAACAVISWTAAEWLAKGKPSLLGAASGAVAGLVAITPAAGFVDIKGAFVIGLASGVVCFWGVTGLKRLLGADDALDCFGVHGVGGILGAVLTGVFAVAAIGGEGKSGLIEGNAGQIGVQIMGILVSAIWAAIGSYVILKLIDITLGLRVTPDEEREGLDLALHGESVH